MIRIAITKYLVASGALGLLFTSGCALFQSPSTHLATNGQLNAEQPQVPQYFVRMVGNRGSVNYSGKLDQNKTVQDALVESEAVKKYKDMEVVILRQDAKSGNKVRLEVDFEPATRRVPYSQDYALLPNDTVMIKQVEFNPLERALESLTGRMN